VFLRSMATVIGPTPPGTGEIQAAFLEQDLKSTSPTASFLTRLYPTSMIIESFFIRPALRNFGLPAAIIITSEERVFCLRFLSRGRVQVQKHFLWLQIFWDIREDRGVENILLLEIIRIFLLVKSSLVSLRRVMMPWPRPGMMYDFFWARSFRFSGWKPSTSFFGFMRFIISVSLRWDGRGSWIRIALVSLSLFIKSRHSNISFLEVSFSKR